MKKKLPKFKSDKQLEAFAEEDISDYIDAGKLVPATFEFEPKSKVVNLRMSEALLEAIKKVSRRRKMPYQRYIRETLEHSLKKSGTRR